MAILLRFQPVYSCPKHSWVKLLAGYTCKHCGQHRIPTLVAPRVVPFKRAS